MSDKKTIRSELELRSSVGHFGRWGYTVSILNGPKDLIWRETRDQAMVDGESYVAKYYEKTDHGWVAREVEPGPAQDWIVEKLVDLGHGRLYRYHVEGVNMNYSEGDPSRRFSWNVPDISNPRYDMSRVRT